MNKPPRSTPENLFVLQKHDAQTCHYDFRLRIGDVLTSWAVPKGLSTDPNDKRLAIRTADHPLDYADFEGVIPEDQYGGGTVLIWDKGTYEPMQEDKTMQEALELGALKFWLKGEKLKGGYAMARTDNRENSEQWIVFKLEDKQADAQRNRGSMKPESVKTGRRLEEIAEEEGQ